MLSCRVLGQFVPGQFVPGQFVPGQFVAWTIRPRTIRPRFVPTSKYNYLLVKVHFDEKNSYRINFFVIYNGLLQHDLLKFKMNISYLVFQKNSIFSMDFKALSLGYT